MVKFLLDQDVYGMTAKFLAEQNFDVVSVSQLGLSRAPDTEVLSTAQTQGRILITRDRDYGNLVFVQSLGAGVIYRRGLIRGHTVEGDFPLEGLRDRLSSMLVINPFCDRPA